MEAFKDLIEARVNQENEFAEEINNIEKNIVQIVLQEELKNNEYHNR